MLRTWNDSTDFFLQANEYIKQHIKAFFFFFKIKKSE